MDNEVDLKHVKGIGVLPMELYDQVQGAKKITEIITCTGISGGKDFVNDMPRTLTLLRLLADGKAYNANYCQITPADMDEAVKVKEVGFLPDGRGCATVSIPLPEDHWLYEDKGFEPPPMPYRVGTDDPMRKDMVEKIKDAARYAIRASTMKGKEDDFDPDAMVQNFIIGMIGYFTPDGLSEDDWANPKKEGS